MRQGFAVTTFLRMALEEEPALTGIPFSPPIFLDLCVAWRRGIRSPWRTGRCGIFAGAGMRLIIVLQILND